MRKCVIVLLISCMMFALCACGGPDTFAVEVVDQSGNAVENVTLQLCKDVCYMETTDVKGQATFEIAIEEGYKLSVLTCPDGYEYVGEAEFFLKTGITSYTLEINKIN